MPFNVSLSLPVGWRCCRESEAIAPGPDASLLLQLSPKKSHSAKMIDSTIWSGSNCFDHLEAISFGIAG
jgi:hypothetical protein